MLAVALFFFSCEDEDSFLGFRDKVPNFQVHYVEIPLPVSSVFRIDSILTDNQEQPRTVLVGEYNDALLGNMRAESFLQLFPLSTTKLDESSKYDSVTAQFQLNFYSYGFTGERDARFTIHEITEDSLTVYKRYYYNSTLGYSPVSLGEATVHVHADSLKKQLGLSSDKQDTLVAKARLDDSFGSRLFALALNDPDSRFSDLQKFVYEIKGLALVPAESGGLLGINTLGTFTRVTLHYHTVDEEGEVKDTLVREFGFNYPSFTHIQADRSGTELSAIVNSYQGFEPPSGLRYIQSGSPLVTKLDLQNFYAFADTMKSIIINSAEFVISDVQTSDGFDPHAQLMLRVIDNQADRFANSKVTGDLGLWGAYHLFLEGNYFVVNSDILSSTATPATISYNSEKHQLSGFATLFVQSLFNNRVNESGEVNENRLRYVGLYPYSPIVSRSVNRTVFNSENVKLRIYYTKPVESTP